MNKLYRKLLLLAVPFLFNGSAMANNSDRYEEESSDNTLLIVGGVVGSLAVVGLGGYLLFGSKFKEKKISKKCENDSDDDDFDAV